MKRTLNQILGSIAFLVFLGHQTLAQEVHEQESKTPDVVKESFSKLYPNAKNVEWFKVNRDHEAEFVENNKSTSILFDRKGNVINQKVEIGFEEYPEVVKEALKQKYIERGFKPLSYMRRTEKEEVIYETLLVKGRELIVVKYTPEGKFVSHVQLAKTLPLDYFPTF